jgi:hypothetical protein
MNKTILEKKDNTFKIDSINLNIFSDTYINDYVTISFYLYNEDRPLPVENTFNISHELFDFIHIKEKGQIHLYLILNIHILNLRMILEII